ncbi:hypothetical protein [Streptomyces hygroscopicus]|uniref:hypothetical protein n=1 Tax=Streptomyces hygroscopicus TaxID=1912 RepID=UPI00131DC12C|nr:hypothetical protein [Streptomyces hygroscopicus]
MDETAAAPHLSAGSPQVQVGVDVVVVQRIPGTTLVTALEGEDPLDLEDPACGDDPLVVACLRGSSLRLDAAEDVAPAVIDALLRSPVPALFRASSWLRNTRALVLENGACEIAGVRLGYQAGVGLWVHTVDNKPS